MLQFRLRYQPLESAIARARSARLAVRAAWLAAAVLVAYAAWGVVDVPRPGAVYAAAACMAVLAAGLAWTARRPAGDAGRTLDRRFGLDDLMVTAEEVDRRGVSTDLDERLLHDAAAAAAQLAGSGARLGGDVRREAETLAAMLLLAVGLTLLGVGGTSLPTVRPLEPLQVPEGVGELPGRGTSSDGQETGGGRGGNGPGGEGAYADVAGQLADHAATKAISDALGRADVGLAAREARALAAASDRLSDAGRADLADALSDAASAARDADPRLGDALERAAEALARQSASGEASTARPLPEMDAVADALDALSIAGGAPGSAERPREPVERAGPPVDRLAAGATQGSLAGAKGHGEVSLGAASGQPSGESAAAPLRSSAGARGRGRAAAAIDRLDVEWRWRSTVRAYFERRAEAP